MQRFLSIFNKLFVLWVILGGIAAYQYPHIFASMKPYMEWFFALTMLGVGMVLDPSDFINIFKHFRVVLVGVTAQFTIMPFGALLVAIVLRLPDDFKLGLILAGSAPGAMASNVLSYLAGADVAYSVSLTTVSTFLAPIMTPLLTLLLAKTMLHIPFWSMFLSVMWMVLVPLLVGIGLRKIFGKRLETVQQIFPAISTLFIVFICAVVIALNKNYLLQLNFHIFAAAILLNLFGLVMGYLTGMVAGFDLLKKRALSIEIGMQNAGLGSVLALKHFNERTALPAVIFVFICIFSASILVPVWSQRGAKK